MLLNEAASRAGIGSGAPPLGRPTCMALPTTMGQLFFTTKEVGKGTGRGLSISRGIVEAHGGHLALDAESSHTPFVVTLPKSVAAQREAALAGR